MNERVKGMFTFCVNLAILAFGIFMAYFLLVMTPFAIWADAKCLSQGFPKYSVTWNLDAYCLNFDGAVTTKVEKLK